MQLPYLQISLYTAHTHLMLFTNSVVHRPLTVAQFNKSMSEGCGQLDGWLVCYTACGWNKFLTFIFSCFIQISTSIKILCHSWWFASWSCDYYRLHGTEWQDDYQMTVKTVYGRISRPSCRCHLHGWTEENHTLECTQDKIRTWDLAERNHSVNQSTSDILYNAML